MTLSEEHKKIVFPRIAHKNQPQMKKFSKAASAPAGLEQSIRQSLSISKSCVSPEKNPITKARLFALS